LGIQAGTACAVRPTHVQGEDRRSVRNAGVVERESAASPFAEGIGRPARPGVHRVFEARDRLDRVLRGRANRRDADGDPRAAGLRDSLGVGPAGWLFAGRTRPDFVGDHLCTAWYIAQRESPRSCIGRCRRTHTDGIFSRFLFCRRRTRVPVTVSGIDRHDAPCSRPAPEWCGPFLP